jgi:hypothetical protein
MTKDFAQALLSESFWSEWQSLDEDEESLISQSEWEIIRRKYLYQQEISESIAVLFSYYSLNLDEFLPLSFVEELVNQIDKEWEGKYSIKQLYEHSKYAAWGCIAKQVGTGVAATDSPEIQEFFEVIGISEPSFNRESPSAWNAVIAVQQAIVAKRSEEIYFDESIGTRLCQWHSGMDAIYAVGSSAIAYHPVPPSVVRDAVDLLDRNLVQVRTNNFRDKNIDELMTLIEDLLWVLPTEVSC